MTDNVWDRTEQESAKAYTAFCDYRDMGVGRSIRALVDEYIKQASSKHLAKPPSQKENTIFTWSFNNEWVARCEAWDNEQTLQRTKAHEEARTNLIEDELRDYHMQLDKWGIAYERLPLHESQHVTTEIDKTTGSVTMSQYIKMNHDDMHRMAKWRDEIAKQGRRALGLPDKVTESKIDMAHSGAVDTGGEFKIVDYRQATEIFTDDDEEDIDNNPG